MLSLRRFKRLKTTLLTALGILLIGAVTGYANHLVTTIVADEWHDLDYEIGAGAHWWNDTDTYSHHYMDLENNSNTWVDLTYKWTHKLKQNGTVLESDQVSNENSGPRRISAGDTYFVQGYLNTHTSGGIPPGIYTLESTTQIKFTNGHGFSQNSYITAKRVDNIVVDD